METGLHTGRRPRAHGDGGPQAKERGLRQTPPWQIPHGTHPPDTLILDLQPQSLETVNVCCHLSVVLCFDSSSELIQAPRGPKRGGDVQAGGSRGRPGSQGNADGHSGRGSGPDGQVVPSDLGGTAGASKAQFSPVETAIPAPPRAAQGGWNVLLRVQLWGRG